MISLKSHVILWEKSGYKCTKWKVAHFLLQREVLGGFDLDSTGNRFVWMPGRNFFGSAERASRGFEKRKRECNGFSAKVENPSEKPL
jgi:hypothetical protein